MPLQKLQSNDIKNPNIVSHDRECYCGDSLPADATPLEGSNCNMLCTGNKREFCGAAAKLDVYSTTP